jgi:hypothetical protein
VAVDEPDFPELRALHHLHKGLTEAIAACYAEAAAVCLSRHHVPPASLRVSAEDIEDRSYRTSWPNPTERQEGAWANRDDATRDGAYCVVIAAVGVHLGLVAVARAETKTGADYYLVRADRIVSESDGGLDLEEAVRLEVSGIDRCPGEAHILHRVSTKVEQARQGRSNLPAIAGVVAFNLLRVIFRNA